MEPIEQIYRKYADTVFRFIFSKTQDYHIAEEVTQETFYQAVRSISKYDGKCKISTWLCAIAKNQLYTYYRKNPQMEEMVCDNSSVRSAEEEVLDNEMRTQMLKILHNCSEPYREVLYLRIWGGLSFKEIGDILNRSENWARITFYRGKEKIREELLNNEK
ncbi:RNA polymerase sigma factor [Faecalimonas sp.]